MKRSLLAHPIALSAALTACSGAGEPVVEDHAEVRTGTAARSEIVEAAAAGSAIASVGRVVVVSAVPNATGLCRDVRGVVIGPDPEVEEAEGLTVYASLSNGRSYEVGMHPDPAFECKRDFASIKNEGGGVDLRSPGEPCNEAVCERMGDLERAFFVYTDDTFHAHVVDTRAGHDKLYVTSSGATFEIARKGLGPIARTAAPRRGEVKITDVANRSIVVKIAGARATVVR